MSRIRPVTAAVLAAVAVTAACTSSPHRPAATGPGVTPKSVLIGSTQPLRGLAEPGEATEIQAAQAYFHSIRAAGGINGRTIDLRYVDDRYQPAQSLEQTKTLVRGGVLAMFDAFGTDTHAAAAGYLNRAKVPDLFAGSGCPCLDNPRRLPYTFGWEPNGVVEGKILGAYIAHHFRGAKVGYFFEADGYGRAGVRGLDRELPRRRVVARVSYRPDQTDISHQVQRLQASGAQVVVAFSLPFHTAVLKLGMLQVKLRARLVVSSSGSDPTTLASLLEQISGGRVRGRPLLQGLVTDTYLPAPAETDNSWIKLFRSIHDTYIPRLPFDGNVVEGMARAYTFAQALAAAGDAPTRAGLVATIERGLPQGPALVPFDYSATSHAGLRGAQVAVVHGGALRLVGAPQVTDDGNGPVRAFRHQPPAAPARGIPTGA